MTQALSSLLSELERFGKHNAMLKLTRWACTTLWSVTQVSGDNASVAEQISLD